MNHCGVLPSLFALATSDSLPNPRNPFLGRAGSFAHPRAAASAAYRLLFRTVETILNNKTNRKAPTANAGDAILGEENEELTVISDNSGGPKKSGRRVSGNSRRGVSPAQRGRAFSDLQDTSHLSRALLSFVELWSRVFCPTRYFF